jgi:hypothetical protein
MLGRTRYQVQMTNFIWGALSYAFVVPFVIWWKEPSSLVSWIVYASTLAILFCLAIGFDAVYDSLSEKLPSDE